jgi:hypothetical protein
MQQDACAEVRHYLLKHFIGTIEQRGRDGQAKRIRGLCVD